MKQHDLKDDSQLPSYFVTAMTLPYEDRIAMQAAFQQHIDASISSTVNVPNSFTVEDTEHLYLLAYESGCKGVTIFRDAKVPGERLKKRPPLQGKALPAEKSLPLMTMSSARNEN